jgi:hypothetical protein
VANASGAGGEGAGQGVIQTAPNEIVIPRVLSVPDGARSN